MMDSPLSLWQVGHNTRPIESTMDCIFYRDALHQGQDYLKQQFESQADVIELVQQRSAFVDEVLQHLWQQNISDNCPVSLLAVGGYGRNELHPYSDIDILVLLDDSISKEPPAGLTKFLTFLWDIGLEIGHSVRTISD
jgi:[protein-PII] uridylyltransferase